MFIAVVLLCGLALANAAVVRDAANKNCGVTDYEPNQYIVGGVEARPHSWPWMASLLSYGSHICGGSLIDNSHVVTAAHCISRNASPSRYRVRLGSHSRGSVDSGQKDQQVRSFKIHDLYSSSSLTNDIAVLEIDPVEYTDTIKPVCWANISPDPGVYVTVTGWGTLSSGGTSPDKLQEVSVPIVEHNQCNTWNNGGVIRSTMICAGLEEGGKDSCQGDSGGPLVYKMSDGRWYLAGIVSWGYGCAGARRPGVYARTSNYRTWITEHSGVE